MKFLCIAKQKERKEKKTRANMIRVPKRENKKRFDHDQNVKLTALLAGMFNAND